MPCLFALFTLLTPRILIVVLWLFSSWFSGIFSVALWPVLGFIFLPTTLLWYSAVQHWFGGHWSFWPIVGLVIALLIDLSPASGRRRARAR
ncbi:MAG TPA: hypothetical protein VFG73_00855 [Rhodanobacteraceae bacterium]|nr:hypothetical protein [Rhodanobacteraceae bacterium]